MLNLSNAKVGMNLPLCYNTYMKTIPLNSKTSIPQLGFGTWQLTGEECVQGVAMALQTGYRHIDTADGYGNHREVAKGIRQSGVAREDLFLTTKIKRDDITKEKLGGTVNRFLEELGTDYIDLLLIHWPNKDIPIGDSLGAMNELKEAGKIRAIGVSNFTKRHIEEALSTGVEVVNNQIEIHPTFKQEDMVSFLQEKGISVTAYSPLGRGQDLALPVIQDIAQKRGMAPAQVILSWLLSRNIIAIPKSEKKEYIESNFQAAELALTPEDIESINAIPDKERMVSPEHAEWDY